MTIPTATATRVIASPRGSAYPGSRTPTNALFSLSRAPASHHIPTVVHPQIKCTKRDSIVVCSICSRNTTRLQSSDCHSLTSEVNHQHWRLTPSTRVSPSSGVWQRRADRRFTLRVSKSDGDDPGPPESGSDSDQVTKAVKVAASVGIGLAIRYLLPIPAGVSVQAWQLLAIFVATIVGLVLAPLPIGAWAFCGCTVAVLTRTLTFEQAFAAYTNEVLWVIVMAFFLARAFIMSGLGERVANIFVRWLGHSTLGLAYGLAVSEAVVAPAMPSAAARAGGLFLPIIRSFAEKNGSLPRDPSARRLGRFLVLSQLQCMASSSALTMTGSAQNILGVQLGLAAAGLALADPWWTWLTLACMPGAVALVLTPLTVYRLDPPDIRSTPEAPAEAARQLAHMGPMSGQERVVAAIMGTVLVLWAVGDRFGLGTAAVTMLGMSAMLLSGVLQWEDCLKETAAWDTLAWFAVLVSMSNQLNAMGLVQWFAGSVSGALASWQLSWWAAFGLLHALYFALHYLFASQTAHVGALCTAFVAMLVASGTPPIVAVFSICFNADLFNGITHYSSGQAALYYGAGYVDLPSYFRMGAIIAIQNFLVWGTVGLAWWKFLGLL